MKRRLLLQAAAGVAALGAAALARSQEKVIKILAKKFEYVPSEITIEKGVPVVLEFTTDDVTMGFYSKELNASAEIVPGKATRVRIVPEKAGTYEFICDVFCGEGHEDMAGKIHVTG
jgi:cytochrome c oxidase subunit 2